MIAPRPRTVNPPPQYLPLLHGTLGPIIGHTGDRVMVVICPRCGNKAALRLAGEPRRDSHSTSAGRLPLLADGILHHAGGWWRMIASTRRTRPRPLTWRDIPPAQRLCLIDLRHSDGRIEFVYSVTAAERDRRIASGEWARMPRPVRLTKAEQRRAAKRAKWQRRLQEWASQGAAR